MSTKHAALQAAKSLVQLPYNEGLSQIYFELLELVVEERVAIEAKAAPAKPKAKAKRVRKPKQGKLPLEVPVPLEIKDGVVVPVSLNLVGNAIEDLAKKQDKKEKAAEKMRAYRAKKKVAA